MVMEGTGQGTIMDTMTVITGTIILIIPITRIMVMITVTITILPHIVMVIGHPGADTPTVQLLKQGVQRPLLFMDQGTGQVEKVQLMFQTAGQIPEMIKYQQRGGAAQLPVLLPPGLRVTTQQLVRTLQ
jgi:hypothetical protein